MKHKLSTTLALVVLTMALAAGAARAQTVANGPYYAPPSWDQTLACTALATCPRFIVLSNMGSNAVLDRETGLVWEKSPSTTGLPWSSFSTTTAAAHCTQLNVGNRKGWRFPTIQELASLVDGDPANTGSPRLPPGHPFQNVQSSRYWSATTFAGDSDSAWFVDFGSGEVANTGLGGGKAFNSFVWCVRGGQGLDVQ